MRRQTGAKRPGKTEQQIDRFVQALKLVPAKRLRIIELANTLVFKDGEVDYEDLGRRQPEINLAVVEAKRYGASTIQAVEALQAVKARVGHVGP